MTTPPKKRGSRRSGSTRVTTKANGSGSGAKSKPTLQEFRDSPEGRRAENPFAEYVERYGGTELDAAVDRERNRQLARRIVATELAGGSTEPPEIGWSMADELELEEPDLVYLIDDVHVTPGITGLFALHKVGKTSLAVSLTKALVAGEPFLNMFPTHLDGHVGYLSYELDKWTLRRWVRRARLKHPERLHVWNLRGKPPVAFWTPEGREPFAEWLEGNKIRYLIVDTVTRAGRGLVTNWSDNTEVGAFFQELNIALKQGGCPNALLLHHMGRQAQRTRGDDEEHARGASALEDEPDSLWYMTKDRFDTRYLRAVGRDVELEATELTFDRKTGLYSSEGKTRAEARDEQALEAAVRAVVHHPDATATQLEKDYIVGVQKSRRLPAVHVALGEGLIEVNQNGRAFQHRPTEKGKKWLRAREE